MHALFAPEPLEKAMEFLDGPDGCFDRVAAKWTPKQKMLHRDRSIYAEVIDQLIEQALILE
jgi:hypothetical protein